MTNVKTILLIGRTGHGKSTLSNVLLGKKDGNGNFEEVFGESAGSVSKTKKVQTEITDEIETDDNEVKYQIRIVDTVGIGDTGMMLDKVLRKLALMSYCVKDGLSQILLVINNRDELIEETKAVYELLKNIVFDEKIADYTTVVITNFAGFREKKECDKLKKIKVDNNKSLRELIEECNEVIFVDNPSTDDNERALAKKYQERREKSREMLLGLLRDNCKNNENDEDYKPENLDKLGGKINGLMKEKEKKFLKESGRKSVIKKFVGGIEEKVSNKLLNKEVTKKMKEHIKSMKEEWGKNIEEGLKQLEEQKKNNQEEPINWSKLFQVNVEVQTNNF